MRSRNTEQALEPVQKRTTRRIGTATRPSAHVFGAATDASGAAHGLGSPAPPRRGPGARPSRDSGPGKQALQKLPRAPTAADLGECCNSDGRAAGRRSHCQPLPSGFRGEDSKIQRFRACDPRALVLLGLQLLTLQHQVWSDADGC